MTDRIKALEDALQWYADQARLARLIHKEGDAGRHALAEDGGSRARAALAASQSAQPVAVTVKPLVWVADPENCGDDWFQRAASGVYLYEVGRHETSGWWWQEDGAVGGCAVDVDGGMDAAKAATQADYEARIMAALDMQPLTMQDALRAAVTEQGDRELSDTKAFGLVRAGTRPAQHLTVQDAALDVLAERARQVSTEGWTPAHDDAHFDGAIARAAASYALSSAGYPHLGMDVWPWSRDWWKPSDRRRDLVKAGALILAEIDRLDRAALRAIAEGRA